MVLNNRLFFVLFFLWGIFSPLHAQKSLLDSHLKFSINRSGGYLRLSGRDERDGSYYPLIDEDPGTTAWILGIDGKSVKPNEDPDWTTEIEMAGDQGRIIRRSKEISLTQGMHITPNGRHLVIEATLTNYGSNIHEVGAEFHIDTLLGEAGGVPFFLPGDVYVTSETVLREGGIPRWVASKRDNYSSSLYVLLNNDGVTAPDTVYLANWLRMREEGWHFLPVPGRSFDNLPFSSGDSAVTLRYDARGLAPGARRVIVVVLGLDPAVSELMGTETRGIENRTEDTRLREYTIRQRMEEIDKLLEDIEFLLANPSELTEKELVDISSRAEDLERRRSEYEDLQ